MSWHEYKTSMAYGDAPFYALIMAAMRRADTSNARKLRDAWPHVWDELQARYDAPGGYLPSERASDAKEEA